MTQVYASQVLVDAVFDYVFQSSPILLNGKLALWTSAPVPGPDMDPAEFVEPTYAGYARKTLAVGTFLELEGSDGKTNICTPPEVFTVTADTESPSVRGWYLMNSDADVVLAMGVFAAPVPMAALGNTVVVLACINIPTLMDPATVPVVA